MGTGSIWQSLNRPIGFRRKHYTGPKYFVKLFHQDHLLRVTELLSGLIGGNFPLLQGIRIAMLEAPNARVRSVLDALGREMAEGKQLSEAMRLQKRFFPQHYVDLVKAGEETGKLYEVFDILLEDIVAESDYRERRTIYAAYIFIELFVQLVLISVLFAYVVPTFIEIAEDFKVTPPTSMTRSVGLGDTIHNNQWSIITGFLVSAALLLLFIRGYGRVPLFHKWLTRIMLLVPKLRVFVIKANLGHAARVLGRLVKARIPMDDALKAVTVSDVSPYYQRQFRAVRDAVLNGYSLRQAFDDRLAFPSSFVGMITLGEESDRLGEVLNRMGDTYLRDNLRTMRIAAEVIAPAMILVTGAITLAVALACYGLLVALSEQAAML